MLPESARGHRSHTRNLDPRRQCQVQARQNSPTAEELAKVIKSAPSCRTRSIAASAIAGPGFRHRAVTHAPRPRSPPAWSARPPANRGSSPRARSRLFDCPAHPLRLEGLDQTLGHKFLRLQIRQQAEFLHAVARWPDRSPRSSRRRLHGHRCTRDRNTSKKSVHPIRTGEDQPVVGVRIDHKLGKGAHINRRFDANGRQFNHVGSERDRVDPKVRAGLRTRARDHDAPAKQRDACSNQFNSSRNLTTSPKTTTAGASKPVSSHDARNVCRAVREWSAAGQWSPSGSSPPAWTGLHAAGDQAGCVIDSIRSTPISITLVPPALAMASKSSELSVFARILVTSENRELRNKITMRHRNARVSRTRRSPS